MPALRINTITCVAKTFTQPQDAGGEKKILTVISLVYLLLFRFYRENFWWGRKQNPYSHFPSILTIQILYKECLGILASCIERMFFF